MPLFSYFSSTLKLEKSVFLKDFAPYDGIDADKTDRSAAVSGSKSVHDIGAPLQLPGELFPQHIVTAAALEKPLVVFHGKIH